MLWSEMKQIWEEGFKKYIYQWWNWLDYLMMCFYVCMISIRLSAYYVFHYCQGHQRFVTRAYWHSYEPMLIAEALFAVANVFSFSRIIYLFQMNPYLGPLQISLGCMLVDVVKFCFIFVLIISSFSIGLAQLYWYYDPETSVCITPESCSHESNAFSSIASSYLTLLWSLFSITKVEETNVIENHKFTQFVGSAMFIVYHMTSIIVLLNMLIAMMSDSFQRVNDAADLEWKFHRTKLWMAHFDEGSTLSPPFNIIVSPKAIYYFLRCLVNCFKCSSANYYVPTKRSARATIKRPGYDRRKKLSDTALAIFEQYPLTYADIMHRLVYRYILQTRKDTKTDQVTEDDLLEIKQDIRSLRYELRDDRRKEIVRSSSHIDAVKRDIIRTMSANRFGTLRRKKLRNDFAESCPATATSLETAKTTKNQFDFDQLVEADEDSGLRSDNLSQFCPFFTSNKAEHPDNSIWGRFQNLPNRIGRIETSNQQQQQLNSSLDAVQKVRKDVNDRLDQLIAQVTLTKTDEDDGSMLQNQVRLLHQSVDDARYEQSKMD